MSFSIPDDLAEAFNKVFEGEDKNAIVVRLMREAVAERERSRHRPNDLVERLRRIRERGRPVTEVEIRRASQELRE